jgi:DNA-binding response OmpR family regulator
MTMRITVVDNTHDLPDILQAALEHAGHHVVLVCDMQRPIPRLRSIRPDAILMNVWTFPLDRGWGTLAGLTADPLLAGVPTVVYSTNASDLQAHALMLQRYGCEVLLAPFHLEDLHAALRRAGLARHEATA